MASYAQTTPARAFFVSGGGIGLHGSYTLQEEPARARLVASRGRAVRGRRRQSAVGLHVVKVVAQLHREGGPIPREKSMSQPIAMIPEHGTCGLAARVVAPDGSLIGLSQVESASMTVVELGGDGETTVYQAALDPEEVLFDTLQLDGYWTVDAEGYTLRIPVLTDAILPFEGGRSYKLEVTLRTTDWGLVAVDGRINVASRSTTP